ncbi:MAG: ABC transporter ATP-binding protein [Syntrophobacteraceae bacterium]
MIRLEKVSKSYKTITGRRIILDNVDAVFPRGKNIGILGKNGAGKSTLLRLIGGVEAPDSGRIIKNGKISFPIGFSGGFHLSLSGRENLRFISRIYEVDFKKVMDFVAEFAELGEYIDMPIKTYSSGMRAKLAFGLSMALDFECYLIDEVTAVGDASFKKKSHEAFSERRSKSNVIMVSHSIATIKQYCDSAAVLSNQRLIFYEDINDAIEFYTKVELKLDPSELEQRAALIRRQRAAEARRKRAVLARQAQGAA